MNPIQIVKETILISSIVSNSVSLKASGNKLWGLCPFHEEKTPSFFVDDNAGLYHCFGCGAHGDVINFYAKIKALDFKQALTYLASTIGIKISSLDVARQTQKNKSYDILQKAMEFMISQLNNNTRVMNYLDNRGINKREIIKFKLGWNGWGNELIQHLKLNKFSDEEITKSSLVGSKGYPFFRNRLIFPIIDLRGKVIAFGGRNIEDGKFGPKYINSSNSYTFNKSYNLFNEKILLKKHDPLIICEGYTDVMAFDSIKISAVATLGTSLNIEHLIKIWRYNPSPTICFDGDEAGIKSAHRIMDSTIIKMLPGTNLNFVFLPDNEDPDTYIKKNDKTAIEDLLTNKIGILDLFLQQYTMISPKNLAQRTKIRKKLFSTLKQIKESYVRQEYLNYAYEYLKQYRYNSTKTEHRYINKENIQNKILDLNKRAIISLLILKPELLEIADNFLFNENFSSTIRPFVDILRKCAINKEGQLKSDDLIAEMENKNLIEQWTNYIFDKEVKMINPQLVSKTVDISDIKELLVQLLRSL